MTKKGMTVEDFELELGYKKGWTQAEGLTIADRIELLNAYAPKTTIDWIFVKHLGTNRYGIPINTILKA